MPFKDFFRTSDIIVRIRAFLTVYLFITDRKVSIHKNTYELLTIITGERVSYNLNDKFF